MQNRKFSAASLFATGVAAVFGVLFSAGIAVAATVTFEDNKTFNHSGINNVQLLTAGPQGRYLYVFTNTDAHALKVDDDTGALSVPQGGENVFANEGADAAAVEYSHRGRYMLVAREKVRAGKAAIDLYDRGPGPVFSYRLSSLSLSISNAGSRYKSENSSSTDSGTIYSLKENNAAKVKDIALVKVNNGIILYAVSDGALHAYKVDDLTNNARSLKALAASPYTQKNSNGILSDPVKLLYVAATKNTRASSLYVLSQASNSITQYKVDSNTGALTKGVVLQNDDSAIDASLRGLNAPNDMALDAENDLLYVSATGGGGTLTSYRILNSGAIFPVERKDNLPNNTGISLMPHTGFLRSLLVYNVNNSHMVEMQHSGKDQRKNVFSGQLNNIPVTNKIETVVADIKGGAHIYTANKGAGSISVYSRISDLGLELVTPASKMEQGRAIPVSVKVNNKGPSDAQNIRLKIYYSGGMMLHKRPSISAGGGNIKCENEKDGSIECTLPNMELSQERTISFMLRPPTLGTYLVKVAINSANPTAIGKRNNTASNLLTVGDFRNGGAVSMSWWAMLLLLPYLLFKRHLGLRSR